MKTSGHGRIRNRATAGFFHVVKNESVGVRHIGHKLSLNRPTQAYGQNAGVQDPPDFWIYHSMLRAVPPMGRYFNVSKLPATASFRQTCGNPRNLRQTTRASP